MDAMAPPLIRSLVLTDKPVFPPIGGAPLRNWQNVNGLRQLGPVRVVSLKETPTSDSEGLRMEWFPIPRPLSVLEQALAYAPPVIANRRGQLLWYSRSARLERLRTTFRPDVVVFAEIAWARLLDQVRRWGASIVYDAHNVETKLMQEIPNQSGSLGEWRRRKARMAEQSFASVATQIWVCSESDRSQMIDACGSMAKVKVIPNGVDSSFYEAPVPSPPELRGRSNKILYAGDFGYPPNAAAAERILSRLLPASRQRLGDVTVCFAGTNPTPAMLEHASRDPQVIVTGLVPDMRPYLKNSDCMLVPLELGGGTRLKILEAFAAGCPVVSTPKGAEGLAADAGTHLLIGSTDAELIAATVELCSRREIARQLTDNARRLVASRYDWAIIHREIALAAEDLRVCSGTAASSAA
jgi:glycosyltransferase involved in cell wall biosynthesis